MKSKTILDILQQKRSVHKLYYGGYIQETLQLKENIYAVPLKALGFNDESNYTSRYVTEICGGVVDAKQLHSLIQQGEKALPVVAIVVLELTVDTPETMEQEAEKALIIPEKIVGWAAGENLVPFAYIISLPEQHFFRILPPHSRQRQRLGFGNTGNDYSSQLTRMIECAEKDEHFLFALSLYRDALAEENATFKIARYFSCLESLAYKLKSKEMPSRKAVKQLLGLKDGAFVQQNIRGKEYKYDRIEISGRLRDKLFHGIPFKEKDLIVESKHVFELLENEPELIANSLRDDCELEFARWSNKASNGLAKVKI